MPTIKPATTPFSVFIPARYQSTRFPGKPLIDLNGKTMIQRVFEQACQSDADRVFVATDDVRIQEVVTAFGGDAILTATEHQSGSDRIHEAVTMVGLGDDDIVVNVQGDEPLIPPEAINQVAGYLSPTDRGTDENDRVDMATLKEKISQVAEMNDPNIVKVVTDAEGLALYFSRAPIPFVHAEGALPGVSSALENCYRHLGIYAYRVSLLNLFVDWPKSALELTEGLEQLRVLYNGGRIHVGEATRKIPPGIDVPEDVAGTLEFLT